MLARARPAGFTLIELMVAVAVTALLLSLALPAFNAFLANSRVRNAAESIQGGLSTARSEAVKRNRDVEFLLFADAGYDLGMVDGVTPNASGPNWLVRTLNPATGTYLHIDWASGYEGSGRTEAEAPATTIAATYPAGLAPADVVVFNPLGGTELTAAARYDVSKPDAGECHTAADPGPIRCLRVQVSVAGQVRLCDPGVSAEDTRTCE